MSIRNEPDGGLSTGLPSSSRRAEPDFQTLANALHEVAVAGNHAALVIGANHPLYTATPDEASVHYGDDLDRYNVWVCWAMIMRASREVYDHLPDHVREESWKAFDQRRHTKAEGKQ